MCIGSICAADSADSGRTKRLSKEQNVCASPNALQTPSGLQNTAYWTGPYHRFIGWVGSGLIGKGLPRGRGWIKFVESSELESSRARFVIKVRPLSTRYPFSRAFWESFSALWQKKNFEVPAEHSTSCPKAIPRPPRSRYWRCRLHHRLKSENQSNFACFACFELACYHWTLVGLWTYG